MSKHFAWVFLLVFISSAAAQAAPPCDQQRAEANKADATPPDPQRFKWWLKAETKKELRLTDQQSKKIDEIWEATAPKLREKWHELEKLQDALDKTIKDFTADVAAVSQQVEKVERLRAEHITLRNVMIYRMYLVLTPEQRVKVDAIRAKMEADRKRQDEERKKDKDREERR